jgi:hypothetical protein
VIGSVSCKKNIMESWRQGNGVLPTVCRLSGSNRGVSSSSRPDWCKDMVADEVHSNRTRWTLPEHHPRYVIVKHKYLRCLVLPRPIPILYPYFASDSSTPLSLAPVPITSTMFLIQFCRGDVLVPYGRERALKRVRDGENPEHSYQMNNVYSEAKNNGRQTLGRYMGLRLV